MSLAIWGTALLGYTLFWWWYVGFRPRVTEREVNELSSLLESSGNAVMFAQAVSGNIENHHCEHADNWHTVAMVLYRSRLGLVHGRRAASSGGAGHRASGCPGSALPPINAKSVDHPQTRCNDTGGKRNCNRHGLQAASSKKPGRVFQAAF